VQPQVSAVSSRLRAQVVNRANGVCEYCRNQQELVLATFEADHIVPRTRGGATTLDNLALACPLCNTAKFTRLAGYDPDTNSLVPLFNPRQQVWERPFRWSADHTEILGITPVGRATVAALNMNRPRVRLMRLRWRQMKLHPPRRGR